MVVELLEDKKRWDQFVETSPQGFLFHKWDFLKTVERHSRYQLVPYCIYSGEELRCIFPFFYCGAFRTDASVVATAAPYTNLVFRSRF